MKPKIYILGQGIIATFIGIAFTRSGYQVLHYVRPQHRTRNGVIIRFMDRRKIKPRLVRGTRYMYPLSFDPEQMKGADWIWLPLGHLHWRQGIKDIQEYLQPHQTLIITGNCWLDDFRYFEETISIPYILAFPCFGGTLIQHELKGWLTPKWVVGITNPQYQKNLDEFIPHLHQTGFRPIIEMDIRGWHAVHFAHTAGMLESAAKLGGLTPLVHQKGGLKAMFQTMRKYIESLICLGIRIEDKEDARILKQPIWWNVLKTRLMLLWPGTLEQIDARFDADDWFSYAQRMHNTLKENKIDFNDC